MNNNGSTFPSVIITGHDRRLSDAIQEFPIEDRCSLPAMIHLDKARNNRCGLFVYKGIYATTDLKAVPMMWIRT